MRAFLLTSVASAAALCGSKTTAPADNAVATSYGTAAYPGLLESIGIVHTTSWIILGRQPTLAL